MIVYARSRLHIRMDLRLRWRFHRTPHSRSEVLRDSVVPKDQDVEVDDHVNGSHTTDRYHAAIGEPDIPVNKLVMINQTRPLMTYVSCCFCLQLSISIVLLHPPIPINILDLRPLINHCLYIQLPSKFERYIFQQIRSRPDCYHAYPTYVCWRAGNSVYYGQ